jgi:hypothetical protein
MSQTRNILPVEPDERLACLVSRYLERHGIRAALAERIDLLSLFAKVRDATATRSC